MGIKAIASIGISLATVGKKDLTNQNVWTESQCACLYGTGNL